MARPVAAVRPGAVPPAGSGDPADPADPARAHAADVASLVAATEEFYASLEVGDLEAMTRLWLDSDSCLCVHPGGVAVHGTAAIRRSWAVVMAATRYAQYVITDLVVHVHGDVGSVVCHENVISEAAGAMPGELAGGGNLASKVFRRTPRGWALWHHHAQPLPGSVG